MATRTLAFEIGTEEIPAFDLKDATAKLADIMGNALASARIPFDEVEILSTPRRLDMVVHGVEEETEAIEEVHRGPSRAIAFDDDGNPTKAAVGFARGKGVDVSELELRDVDGTEYVFAVIQIDSKRTMDLLPALLKGIIDSISWPKSMRWNVHRELFTRPVRWLLALYGDEIVPIEYAGLSSSDETCGHRVLSPGMHKVAGADDLVAVLHRLQIVPTQDERSEVIYAGIAEAEKKNPGLDVVVPEKTMAEVVNLSEHPQVLVGQFDEEFLEVPEEIIVDAMLMHQRYFPMYRDGRLANKFVIVSNGNPECAPAIIDGNERVVAARLYDARFFYNEDLKAPLESYVERLDEVVFQEGLGTMRDKTSRIEQLAEHLGLQLTIDAVEREDVARAARLAKADLVTNAVIEFTSVQGIMGSYYAIASGENEVVACAVAQHYQPRFSGDEVPESTVGRIVAMADKLDTICGLFALDQAPTGTSDPFGLRRAALGIIAIMSSGLEIDLGKAVKESLGIYRESGVEFDLPAVLEQILDFFVTRTRVMLRDGGYDVRIVDSILATGEREPIAMIERTEALADAMENAPETFDDLSTAFVRASNLRDADMGTDVDASLFGPEEAELSKMIDVVRTEVATALDSKLYPTALESLSKLRTPIDAFFESTMIMVEDDTLRANRIRLLNRLVEAFSGIADFSKIARKKS